MGQRILLNVIMLSSLFSIINVHRDEFPPGLLVLYTGSGNPPITLHLRRCERYTLHSEPIVGFEL